MDSLKLDTSCTALTLLICNEALLECRPARTPVLSLLKKGASLAATFRRMYATVVYVRVDLPNMMSIAVDLSHGDITSMLFEFSHITSSRTGVRLPSSARRMVDDSEGKAIGSGDCHMTPVRKGPVSGPIHRPQFIDPVLRGGPRYLQAILPEHCLVKGLLTPSPLSSSARQRVRQTPAEREQSSWFSYRT